MVTVATCDVVSFDLHPNEELLVVGVESEHRRLHAGVILRTAESEVITSPGTYLPEHLSGLQLVGSWQPERAAAALARFLFTRDSAMYERNRLRWLDSLEQNLREDYIIRL